LLTVLVVVVIKVTQVIGIGPGAASRVKLDTDAFDRVSRALSMSTSMQQQWLKRRNANKDATREVSREELANDDTYFAGKNLRIPERYVTAVRSSGIGLDLMHSAPLDRQAYERELLLLGLRLVSGTSALTQSLDLAALRSLESRGMVHVSEVSNATVHVRIDSDMLALADEIALKIIR
jgi:hypothetical protein